jgi:uncharacterized protein with NRDE domain
MCTLVAATDVASHALVVAFNRDERLDRPASPPGRLLDDPIAVGGRDEQEGGTWFGATRDGFLVGVLNRGEDRPRAPGRRSRGLLVLDLLRAGSVGAAVRALSSIDSLAYNPFWILLGAAGELCLVTGGGNVEHVRSEALAGATVLCSGPDPAALAARRQTIDSALPDLLGRPWPDLATGLGRLLATHDATHPLRSVCVHAGPYGTRSSTLVAVDPGRVAAYLHADGPPCTRPFEDMTSLLRD